MICEKWTTIRSELFETVVCEIRAFLSFSSDEQFKILLSNKTSNVNYAQSCYSKVNYALSKYLAIVLQTDNVV